MGYREIAARLDGSSSEEEQDATIRVDFVER